jgi:hypothetical protein
MQKKMAEEIPGGKYIVFDDLSHVMYLENAEPILRVIKEMITQMKSENGDAILSRSIAHSSVWTGGS